MSARFDVIFFIAFVIIFSLAALLLFPYLKSSVDVQKEERQRLYQLYKECKVIEVNHYNGFFEGTSNKLDCNGTIYNVSTSDYDDVMANH